MRSCSEPRRVSSVRSRCRCARCSARRCARNARRQSAPRRRSPSVIAALPPPPLAENLPRLPSPTARPAPISLRSSGPLSVQVEVSQLHLTAWPDGHLNYTHSDTAERPENSTTSVDANRSPSPPPPGRPPRPLFGGQPAGHKEPYPL